MAHKKVTIDLNGGDAVTANGDLLFQLHDGGTDAILAECTYAKLGSENAAGSDASVTINITGDVAVLDHVDIGAATSLKYRVKDEAGNESALSAAKDVSSSIIVFEDDFTGTTIDAAKWNVTNNSSASLLYSQNDEFEAELLNTGSATTLGDDFLDAKTLFAMNEDWVLSFDVKMSNQAGIGFIIGMVSQVSNWSAPNDRLVMINASATEIKSQAFISGTIEETTNQTLDLSTYKSLKIRNLSGVISWQYWNGSAWTSIGLTYSHSLTANWTPALLVRNDNVGDILNETINVDKFRVSNADFSTQYPV